MFNIGYILLFLSAIEIPAVLLKYRWWIYSPGQIIIKQKTRLVAGFLFIQKDQLFLFFLLRLFTFTFFVDDLNLVGFFVIVNCHSITFA